MYSGPWRVWTEDGRTFEFGEKDLLTSDRPEFIRNDLGELKQAGHVRWKSRLTLIPGPNKLHAMLQPAP